MRVLIVEDELPILDALADLFQQQEFDVTKASEGRAALALLEAGRFDLVLLDWMIPELDGIEVLRHIRARGDRTPVLLLTAKGTEEDVVVGLEAGADDYVTKPFGIRELVARAKGLVRRLAPTGARKQEFDGAVFDYDALTVRSASHEISLTAREADLLAYMIAKASAPISREELLVEVWGYRDGNVRTRTVDVHVQQLRAKLKTVPGAEDWIATIRGRGYRFEGT